MEVEIDKEEEKGFTIIKKAPDYDALFLLGFIIIMSVLFVGESDLLDKLISSVGCGV